MDERIIWLTANTDVRIKQKIQEIDMSCTVADTLPQAAKSVASTRAMTVFATAAAITFSASAAAPTPLYRHYQEVFGLSPAVLTIVFSAYVFSVLAALLTVGTLSDYVGRRPVIFGALVLNVVAETLFIEANSAALLIAARIVQGFATGAAITTLGATILETNRARGALVNSITAFLGLAAGALGAGALVAFGTDPAQLVSAILLGISVVFAVLVWQMPETANRQPGALASLRPQVHVPVHLRTTLAQITPVNIAAWALGGFNLSLMPSLVQVATGITSPFTGAVVVAAVMFMAALAVVAMRNRTASQALDLGTPALIAGVLIILAAVHAQMAFVMMAGASAAGFGFGAAFSGLFRKLLPLAAPSERAGLVSAFYVESYLAFSLPAILAGLAAPSLGLELTTYIYGAAIILLAIASLITLRASRKRLAVNL
jgi:predicted MFS family arabinose efflux permease